MTNHEPNNPSPEQESTRNFLDKQLQIKIEITDEAFAHFPEITDEMLQTKREVFRLFLGTWKLTGQGQAVVTIEAVFEIPDQPEFYEETKLMVMINNFQRIQQLAESIGKNLPEYSHLSLVGDLHTHPILDTDLPNGIKPYQPSTIDLESSIKLYSSGLITGNQPYISTVAGRLADGKTAYTTYRVIKEDSQYAIERIE